MKPRKISITKQIALGWFIGFLVAQPLFAQVPGLPQPVIVIGDTSPTTIAQMQQQTQQTVLQTSVAADAKQSRIQTYLEYVKQAERWADTVNQYSETKIREVQRFTTLKGTMGFAEKQIGLSTDTLKAMGDVGELIRGVYTLKKQYQSLVRTRLAMIANLERRGREGIFNPTADLQDLEDYLQNSIGRSAQATLATREKLAEHDDELELWTHQLVEVRRQLAEKEVELKKIQDELKKEAGLSQDARQTGANEDGTPADTGQTGRVSLSAEKIATLTTRTGQLEIQIIELKKQEAELIDKIKQRFDEYHARFDDSFYTAKKWQQTLDGWQMFSDIKKQEIRNMIDHYGEGGTVTVSTPTPSR